MKLALKTVAWLALVLTILPSVVYLSGSLELPTVKTLMLAATVIWFAASPFIWKKESPGPPQGSDGAAGPEPQP